MRNNRSLLKQIDRFAKESGFNSLYVARVKYARQTLDIGLREAKEWVEAHYAQGGRGEPIEQTTPWLYVEFRGRVILELGG